MEFSKVYFVGIGGIGMSAIARFFLHEGKSVAGYDRTCTELTAELENEGIYVTYEDSVDTIPEQYRINEDILIVYTPAVPDDSVQMGYFRENGFPMVKRSRMLGIITEGKYVMAVAGTHGKTTTTTMTAWFNHVAGGGGSAFLGGVSKNFGSNLVLDEYSERQGENRRIAVEADEFDRSFLQLYPDVAVITSVDADHLDIYGTHDELKSAFTKFANQIKPGGALVLKKGVDLAPIRSDIKIYRYSCDSPCDFYADNIRLSNNGYYRFDVVCPDRIISDCTLGIPGYVNIENCIAAVGILWVAGFDQEKLKEAIASFKGVRRRFDFYINTPERVYLDDYAHHPEELKAAIISLKNMLPGKKLTVVFQPHLYTRTKDFYREFADALSLADDLLLLPIYPAREEPIEGVESEMLLPLVTIPARVVQKTELLSAIEEKDPEFLVTFGAGDIDRFCQPINELLSKKK